ncbi:MAG: chemotaxis protein CheA, partial [Pseudomonadales bacterium]
AGALSEDDSGAALVAGLVPRLRVLAGARGLPREVVDPPALTLPGSRAEAEWAPLSKSSAPLPLGAPPMLVRSDLGSADAVAVPERQAEEPAAADDVVRVRRSLLREVEMLAQESGVVQAKITELLRAMEQDAVADPGVSAMVAKRNDIQALTERWERAQGHLQDRLKRASMLPCSRLLSRLRATVLSVANALGKDVEFVCSGSDVLIDGELLYALAAPLEHLLRNAVDHGIETADRRSKLGKPVVGRVSVAFQRLGTEVAIEVTDDGAGLDLTGIQARAETLGLLPETGALDADSLRDLIFKPGFSTSAEISQISGRGVGLDAARYALEQLGGSLSCTSEEGVGSAFRLALPAAAVFDRVLVVRAGEARYAVPIDSIEAVLRVNAHLRIEDRAGALWLEFRGAAYTLRSLADSLQGRPAVPRVEEQSAAVLLVGNGARGVAFAVDAVEVEFLEQGRELLALPVGPMLRGLPWLAGAAVLGQADVMLVLDLPGLVSALPEIDAGAREFVESAST